MASSTRHHICPKCGYIYGGSTQADAGVKREICPKCGANIAKWTEPSAYRKWFYAFCFIIAALAGAITYLYHTNKGVANEFRQIRQPKPNSFVIIIDMSATIHTESLEDFKEALISRLKNFIGDKAVSYHISTIGNPGCGLTSVADIISIQSPDNPVAFKLEVEEKIRKISVARVPADGSYTAPLTTPLYCYFQKILPEKIGTRFVIFTDMMNDDSDCRKQFAFPEDAFIKFGTNSEGQFIVVYPTPTPELSKNPYLTDKILQKQTDAIKDVQNLVNAGKVRAYFYHIPEDPKKRQSFMKSQLSKAIPATAFEVMWERTTKMVDTIVSAVRG